jgi:hypothetical protein
LAYRTGDLKINYEIPAVKRLKQAFQIYCEQGTLENTGKILQLTRERVRQLLVKGTKLGLFNYKGYDYPYVSKDEILNNYRNALNLRDSSTNLGISVSYLQKLIAAYGIKKSEFERIKIEEFKSRCVSEFQGLAQKLGKTPTSTDLQATNKGRYLYNRIFKLWGGIDEFRENIKIEKPPRMHFGERMRPWREKKQRLALIIRMQNLDSIRDFLKENGVQGISAISLGCNLKPPRTYQLLKLLTASGEIQKIGDKFDTVYKLKGRKIGGEDGNLN